MMFNWETHLDFVGQYHAEQLYRAIISAFGVAGIAYGYYLQSFLQTTYVLLAGAALACVVTLPPWPFYRRNPLKWLKAIPIPDGTADAKDAASPAAEEKDKPKKKKNKEN